MKRPLFPGVLLYFAALSNRLKKLSRVHDLGFLPGLGEVALVSGDEKIRAGHRRAFQETVIRFMGRVRQRLFRMN